MKVLFVCLGNICRSPMAEGIFRSLPGASVFKTDSAGTGGWHKGEPPDLRAQQVLKKHGLDISDLRARQFHAVDFEEFDWIICMDQKNYSDVSDQIFNDDHKKKIKLMLDYHPERSGQSVPDPYFGQLDGFEEVYQMLTVSCQNFLKAVTVK